MNARLLGWSAAALFSLSACSGLTGEARTDHTNCMQGSYGDCISLADRYQDGDGVEADADRAAELYLRTCRHKASLGGCTALAALAGDASLTSITIEDAEDALWSACRGYDFGACEQLVDFYNDADLSIHDPARAAAIAQRMCDDGLDWMCE